jgi:hypothetical protein
MKKLLLSLILIFGCSKNPTNSEETIIGNWLSPEKTWIEHGIWQHNADTIMISSNSYNDCFGYSKIVKFDNAYKTFVIQISNNSFYFDNSYITCKWKRLGDNSINIYYYDVSSIQSDTSRLDYVLNFHK